jgi:hypothetical protein
MLALNEILKRSAQIERTQKKSANEAVIDAITKNPELYKKYVSEVRKAAIDRQPGNKSPYMDKINAAVAQQVMETGQTENEALLSYLATPVGADLYRQHVEFLRKDPQDRIYWEERNRNQH